MPLISCNYMSAPLGKLMGMHAVIPDGPGPFPVVYLLHGMSDDHTSWQRWTTVERMALRHGIMLVMLDGDLSFYTDVPKTKRLYETHILHAVTRVDELFHTIPKATARAIGGLSMGGYGALKLGLKHPDVFASASSHSGVADLARWMQEADHPEFKDIWPSGKLPARDDLFHLAKPGMRKPHLFLDCGTSDFLLENNRAFRDLLVRRRIPHIYLEHPGGHNWDYWQAHIGEALDFHVGHFRKAKHL